MLWLNNVSGKFQFDTAQYHVVPCYPARSMLLLAETERDYSHAAMPCTTRYCKRTSKKFVLQVQCDVFLQWLWRILKQAPLGDCMVGGLGRHISHLSSGFLIQGCMWCAVGLMFGYPWPFGEFNVQYRRLPLPFGQGKSSRARHPSSMLARKGLAGARRVGKRSGSG